MSTPLSPSLSRVALLLLALLPAPWARAAADVPFAACFDVAAALHDVPPELLVAVATTESSLDADARSAANAHGLMQIRWPLTARHLGVRRVSELYNPCRNIELGARYLRELLDRSAGDETRALASYNYGPSRIDAALARDGALPEGARRYVDRVAAHRARLLAGDALQARNAIAAVGADLVRFDRSWRAQRLVSVLNARFDSARFDVVPAAHGGALVRMRVVADALSARDARYLEGMGWDLDELLAAQEVVNDV